VKIDPRADLIKALLEYKKYKVEDLILWSQINVSLVTEEFHDEMIAPPNMIFY
jgi:hypothetical protein